MKNNIIFILFICILLSGCSATSKSKETLKNPTASPMKSAKRFIRALTTGDEELLNTVIYHTQSMPSSEIMSIAKMRKITGMKQSDFTYSKDPTDKDTVIVSFKDSNGEQDKWRLVFVENDNVSGNYQYNGFLSGTLLANTTLEMTTHSYIRALINSNAFQLENISERRSVGNYDHMGDRQFVQKYGLNKLKFKDLKILRDGKVDVENEMRVLFTDKNGEERGIEIGLVKKIDGYYFSTSYNLFFK